MIKLIRFWFRFIPSEKLPSTIQLGCGVTAYSYDDALFLLKKIHNEINDDDIQEYIENINIQSLDQNHIIPNMKMPNLRGIWFPIGY